MACVTLSVVSPTTPTPTPPPPTTPTPPPPTTPTPPPPTTPTPPPPTTPTPPPPTTPTGTNTTTTQTVPCKLLGMIDVQLPQDMCGIAQLMAIGGVAIGGLFVLKIVSDIFSSKR